MGKKSKRKAEKLARKYAERPVNFHITPAEVNLGAVAEEIARRSGFELTPQPRWEIGSYRDRDALFDNATGLYAVYVDEYATLRSDILEDINDLETGKSAVESFTWTHAPTGADVLVKTETQDERFWPIHHEDLGWAMLDRYTTLIHPMGAGDPPDTAVELAAAFNIDAEKWLEDCAEDAAEEGNAHWITPEQWADTPPDPEDSLADLARQAGATESDTEVNLQAPPRVEDDSAAETPHAPGTPPNAPPIQVLVVSSSSWPYGGVVGEVLQHFWNARGNPPMTIMTSGSTYGAEGAARQLAGMVEGITHQRIEDKEIAFLRFDMVFAFIRDYSVGASRVLAAAEVAGHPIHRIEERTPDNPSEWAER